MFEKMSFDKKRRLFQIRRNYFIWEHVVEELPLDQPAVLLEQDDDDWHIWLQPTSEPDEAFILCDSLSEKFARKVAGAIAEFLEIEVGTYRIPGTGEE